MRAILSDPFYSYFYAIFYDRLNGIVQTSGSQTFQDIVLAGPLLHAFCIRDPMEHGWLLNEGG